MDVVIRWQVLFKFHWIGHITGSGGCYGSNLYIHDTYDIYDMI